MMSLDRCAESGIVGGWEDRQLVERATDKEGGTWKICRRLHDASAANRSGVTDRAALRDLRQLVDEQLVRKEGYKKTARYVKS